jgi:molybdopterin synthase sulfur carrier subunit
MTQVRVVLPGHLKRLAQVEGEVQLDVAGDGPAAPPTIAAVLDAIESAYPVLRGTIRDQATGKRRNFIRFFACNEDLSHAPSEEVLPDAVAQGREPFLVVGAMAGG